MIPHNSPLPSKKSSAPPGVGVGAQLARLLYSKRVSRHWGSRALRPNDAVRDPRLVELNMAVFSDKSPQRLKCLLAYQTLIVREARQCGGRG